MVLKTTLGAFWPMWKLRFDFAHLPIAQRPKIRKKMTLKGVEGALIDKEPWGIPTHCSELFEIDEDGIEYDKNLIKSSELNNPGDLIPTWCVPCCCCCCWRVQAH